MALTSAEREFLSAEWRWEQNENAAIKARHIGAREAEYGSPFVTLAGAQVALGIIVAATGLAKRLVVVTVDGKPDVSFKGRPRHVRLKHGRYAGDAVAGKLYMLVGAAVDHGASRTTLTLLG